MPAVCCPDSMRPNPRFPVHGLDTVLVDHELRPVVCFGAASITLSREDDLPSSLEVLLSHVSHLKPNCRRPDRRRSAVAGRAHLAGTCLQSGASLLTGDTRTASGASSQGHGH